MIRLLSYQSHEYFAQREHDQFLWETIGGITKIAKIFKHNGNYYYDYDGIQCKCITTPSISLKELAALRIMLSDEQYPIRGKIGGEGYGLSKSPFIYVFWDQGIPTKLPMPTALYSTNKILPLFMTKNNITMTGTTKNISQAKHNLIASYRIADTTATAINKKILLDLLIKK
ncbi:MAG: hypothetical protein HC836_39360 [Richelia sp. RM2_1_2]|nr:hypothetical protein [Richelia sp. RM2_1_2]